MADALKWYDRELKHLIDAATDILVDEVAHEILEKAEDNIRANSQIDTGFLLQTGYVESAISSTYHDTPPYGEWVSPRTGQLVFREAGTVPPGREGQDAIVGFAATYAIYPELDMSYLWLAVEEVGHARDMGIDPNLDIL